LARVRLQRTKNTWTRLTWPLLRRFKKLPAHAAPTYIAGIDEEGWTVERGHPSGVVVRSSKHESEN
jgi:hypothetical protein